MAADSDRIGKITTSPDRGLLLIAMTAVERLSELFAIEVDVVARGGPVDLHPCLANPVSIKFSGRPHISRYFHGLLCEYSEIGRQDDSQNYIYRLLLRPQHYLKTLNRWSKIHHNKSMADLIGMIAPRQQKFQANYSAVEYRVQYDESDFEFVARHMEREGIYFYFDHQAGSHTLIAVDTPAAHPALSPATTRLVSGQPDGKESALWWLREHRRFGPTAYSIDDYDYTKPSASLKQTKAKANLGRGANRWRTAEAPEVPGKVAERFAWPGHYGQGETAAGARYASVRLDADRSDMALSHAEGNLFAAAVGRKLKIAFDENDAGQRFVSEQEYLIVGTRHRYSAGGYRSGSGGNEDMRVELELMPVQWPFRPAMKTPLPRIMGPQTAVVIGPSGEEIHTDKYGRVKVKFFWDSQGYDGGGDVPGRSLWVRVAQMSAGRGYGAFMIPRIGHEVVVDFLNGDPDRPLVTGCVYNEDNLPAFGTAPANPVQGLRTNSSKGGGGFNEIRLDDTKDSEVFSVQAQKDLKTLVLKGDETRDIKEGSRTTTIDKGNEVLAVKTGKRTTTIKADELLTVEQGNRDTTISQGNETLTVSMGNRTTRVKMGNDSLKIDLGKQETEAMQSIELKVGSSSIKIDQMGVTIKGLMIKIEATTMFETKGLMMQQQASAIHILKGAMVMIN